ncbi:MAG TPA: GntR family transcriptional regulator [Streptosporangiaceae bacterium]|nr:GntR family transcriptional regulator [Streptosporangiaceae bacterium]
MVKGTAELQRPVPLYMQVVRQLRAQIASGELAEGERIPSQREMMQIWRISLQTASKVIGALKTECLAIPSIGRDTIVAPGAPARIAAAAAGTAQSAAEPPADSGHDVIATAEMTAAPADFAAILGVPAGRRVLRRIEIRHVDGKPFSFTAFWLPSAITAKAPRLADSKPLPAGPIAYIADVTDSRVGRIIEAHAAMPADADIAKALAVAPHTAVLVRRRQHQTVSGQLIAYSETTTPAATWDCRSYVIAGT